MLAGVGEQVAVGVHRLGDRRVTEALLDDLRTAFPREALHP